MKVHVVTKIARQYEGELILINAIKAFTDKDKAKWWIMSNRMPGTETIEGVQCLVEIGLIEDIEIEE